jgi:hypothetical protein
MSQIRASIHLSHTQEINHSEKKFNNVTEETFTSDEEDVDNENDELIDGKDQKYWNRLVNSWIEMLNNEELEDSENLDSNFEASEVINFDVEEFLEQTIHPADNTSAKWPLNQLFTMNLPIPAYVQSQRNF